MCILRSFGDLITARTLIPAKFLSMHFVSSAETDEKSPFLVLSGDERRGTPAVIRS